MKKGEKKRRDCFGEMQTSGKVVALTHEVGIIGVEHDFNSSGKKLNGNLLKPAFYALHVLLEDGRGRGFYSQ